MPTFTHLDDVTRKSNPKAAILRVHFADAPGYGNQRKHDLRIGPQPGYVNPDLSELNRVLVPPMATPEIKTLARDRRAQRSMQRAMKRNAGVAIIGLIGFGIEAQIMFSALAPEEQEAALRTVVERVANDWRTSVTGLVLHHDETAPHAHFSLCGYDLEGEPLSTRIKRGPLRQLQTTGHEVLRHWMPALERGRSRMARLAAGAAPHEVINRQVAELHRDLPGEIAEKQRHLEALEAAIAAGDARLRDQARALEVGKAAREAARRAHEAVIGDRQALKAERSRVETEKAALAMERERLAAREQELADRALRSAQEIARDAARTGLDAVAGVLTGTIVFDDARRKWVVKDKALQDRLRPVAPAVLPAVEIVHTWVIEFRKKIADLAPEMRDTLTRDLRETARVLAPPEDPDDDDRGPGHDGPGV